MSWSLIPEAITVGFMISLGDLVIPRQLMFHDVLLFSLPLKSLRSIPEPLSSL